jgi:acetyl esterase/lipase
VTVIAYVLAVWALVMNILTFWRVQAPLVFLAWMPKLIAGALSPIWLLFGLLDLVLGLLAGASASGHLSLLAAYAAQHPRLTPEERKDADLGVRGVISLYGPSDMRAVYTHTNQQRLAGLPKVAIGPEAAHGKKNMRDAGRLDILFGGHSFAMSEAYDLSSPITQVHPDCPSTLLIQGEHDLITPISATRQLRQGLAKAGVPIVSIELPCTNHAFDLLPWISPSYQWALYAVDRFLAMVE